MLCGFTCKHADHRCEKEGCGIALALDGNMKNHRYVCCATHAGYAGFEGLHGRIRTGCPNTPAFKSSFCGFHAPTVAVHHDVGDDSITNEGTQLSLSLEGQPVGLLIDKRITRNSTLYKVYNTRSALRPA